ncbi:MAG TPA: hypothetical protein VHW67_13685 [Solirubrobacteraceae bacterium]|nr:hypothetical protein [Solirubrobacteraceae bacterium]
MRSARSSGLPRLAAASLLAALTTLLLALATPAHALIHRGHTFATSFETLGANKLNGPSAVSVNERTSGNGAGDIYVLDKGNNRVVRFGPNHEFLEAWGAGVKGGTAYEKCSSEAECKPGIAGLGGRAVPIFDEPVAIAVDSATGSPSAGDVYVVANRTWKKAIIFKFNFEGTYLGAVVAHREEKEEVWPIDGIAVDRSGNVWVDREDEEEEFVLEHFNNAVKNELIGEPEEIELPEVVTGSRPARPGFGIDSLGHAYITYEPGGLTIEEEEELFEERSEERKEKKEAQVEEHLQEPCKLHACLVAQFKITVEAGGDLAGEVENPDLAPEANTTGIAVDLSAGAQASNDVYLDNETSISAFTSNGTLIQAFGQAQLAEGGGSGLAVNAATNEVFAADAAHSKILVYEPAKAGPPVIGEGSVSTASVTAESAKLKATIDPTGSDTHYRFRYGTAPCTSAPSACTTVVPAAPGTDIGAGFGDQPAATEVAGLASSTTYHFVAIAESALGTVESVEEGTFKTLAASTLEEVLPDGRAWELVSPVEKRGVSVEPLSHEGGLIQAAANGKGFAFIAAAPVGEEEPAGNRAPEPAQLIASRGSAGSWSTRNLTTPNAAAQGIQANERREYQFFSEDLALGAVFPVEPLQSSQTTEAATGLPVYLRDTGCATAPCYQPVTKTSTSKAGVSPLGASTPDLKHIGLITSEGLIERSAEEAEPGEGHLRTVSIFPSGQAATGILGFGTTFKPAGQVFQGARNVISRDGSRVAWGQEIAGANFHLYQTEFKEGNTETAQVDEPNEEAGLAAPSTPPLPVYQTSSIDGSRLFFTDNQRLTSNASKEDEFSGDLYVFERGKPAGERLTDLTPTLSASESAAVLAGVIGAGEDGSYVYFVANGVLAEGVSPGKCIGGGLRSAKCNLYEVHNNGSGWEKPKFIARLSNEDGPDWGPISSKRTEYKVVEMTSRVSPNGHYLAFMSDQRLTGYNNNDANSGEPDEEVYLFNAQANEGSGRLTCASCNPTGAQPIGIHDVQESGEGRGLLVDRLGIWSTEFEETANAHWLAASVPGWTNLDDRESLYQSRYLSNSGRLFYNASDSLVKQDVNNGKEDVYQYEPTGTGDCVTENTTGGCVALISSGKSEHESAFLDASESGNDVFFLTSSSLIPTLDTDKAFDIYDARVCSGAGAEEACPPTALPPAPPCNGEGCRPAPGSQPNYGTPASATGTASGNLVQQQVLGTKQTVKPKAKPLTRAQKLSAALKTCKKKYKSKKAKRLACEKQARKKYGAKKSTKSSGAKSSTKAKHQGTV